jgi:hypothetical protein
VTEIWADTNQRLFEDALDRARVRHARRATVDTVLAQADQVDPRWLDDLARELGATRLEEV